jgi:hypothetical protein
VGLFFEVIVVTAVTWLLSRSVLQWRRERRLARATTGMHDAGVWVNERAWMSIVAQLEGEPEPAPQPDQAHPSDQVGSAQLDQPASTEPLGHEEHGRRD